MASVAISGKMKGPKVGVNCFQAVFAAILLKSQRLRTSLTADVLTLNQRFQPDPFDVKLIEPLNEPVKLCSHTTEKK